MTVETEANGYSKSTYDRGPSLVLRWGWARRANIRDFCPTLVGTVQNIIFLTVHYFTSFVPVAQQAGQAAVLGRLSFNMSLVSTLPLH